MTRFDAVVIGAGNAGLAAAIHLAHKGKKTLIVEQHNLPGGCASSFVRGRFEIEPSLHELCGQKGVVGKLFQEAGVEMEWIPVPDCFRTISVYSSGEEMDVTMPSGREAFIRKMEFYVPGTREKMEKLFLLFDECERGVGYFSSVEKMDLRYVLSHFPNLLVVGSYSAEKVFHSIGLPQKAIDILSTYWSYLGVELSHLSFLHYTLMVNAYITEGAVIPSHTSHSMSEALVEAFRKKGGEIWYNCRAEEILCSEGSVVGVRTTLGDIATPCVLPNINEDIVYGRMVPEALVPDRKRRLSSLRKQRYGARMITAYFCLDVPHEALGIKDYSLFFSSTADSSKEYQRIMGGYETNHFAIFLCYNVINPNASPEGTCICSFTTFASPKEWEEVEDESYFALKEKYAERFLEILKTKAGIDLSGHIEELSFASPWTFARYLGTPEGSVYGHETRDWDDIISRTMSIRKDYPIKGLRPIGADGTFGDGYPSAYNSGLLMAELAFREMGGEEV